VFVYLYVSSTTFKET